MLKNHKILTLIITLTTSGILVVLSIWLWNSYKSHQELTMAKADQALMNVLNDHLSARDFPVLNQRTNSQKNLVQDIKTHYPSIEIDSIYAWMDKNATKRQDSIRKKYEERENLNRRRRRPGQRPREFNPWFLYNRDVNFSEKDVDSISNEYTAELESKDIFNVKHTIILKKIDRGRTINDREIQRNEHFTTRPILINPDSDLFLFAELHQTWRYILSKMAWQIVFSTILILALIGTFLTLLKTVEKQNKLAKLQRAFVNNMTHELKTPLSTVTAAIEAIQRYGAKDDKERMNKYLDLSKREVEHLTRIVEKVLQFNINGSHGTQVLKQNFDLIKLAKDTIESFELSSNGTVTIDFKSSSPYMEMYADESHIRNVLSNLLDNAIKYNTSSDIHIAVRITEQDDKITIQVQDNGIGIPKTYHKNIFDVFFRVPKGDLYSVKGFGLGLAYVHQVIQQHDGSISLDSQENQGTTFTIKIPKNSC